VATPFNEMLGVLSPDGRWLAFTSDESGRPEVYVRAFDSSGDKWRISSEGGSAPAWRGDGKELFYQSADGGLMASLLTTAEGLRAEAPKRLFGVRIKEFEFARQFDVTPDGQRFLVNTLEEPARSEPIRLIVNWTAGLSQQN